MQDTLTRYLEGVANNADRQALRAILTPIADRLSTCPLGDPGLVISSGGATTAKTGATDWYGLAGGVLVKVAASTTLPALTGLNITAASFNIFSFFVDSAGTVSVAMGTEGTTLALTKFPPFPQGKCLLGSILVTYASTFTGGTTPLDTATSVYLNTDNNMDPSVLV